MLDRFDEAQKYALDKRRVAPVQYGTGTKFEQLVNPTSPVDFINVSSTDDDYSDEEKSHELEGEKEHAPSYELNDPVNAIQTEIDDNGLQVSTVDDRNNENAQANVADDNRDTDSPKVWNDFVFVTKNLSVFNISFIQSFFGESF